MRTNVIRFAVIFIVSLVVFDLSHIKADTAMCIRLFDYEKTDENVSGSWRLINDDVMGGRSVGRFVVDENYLSFSGFINTNGGGFSSIRHSVPSLPFIGIDHLRLSVRSDGRPYTVSLADDFSARRGISHRVKIDVGASDNFQEVKLHIDDLVPMFRGRTVQAPLLDTRAIEEVRVMLSDSIDGDFRLDIKWIEVCR